MKTGTVVLLIIAFIAVAAVSFLVGRKLPHSDLQTEIQGLKEIVVSQADTIARMDSTIQSYDTAIREFVIAFDTFKVENSEALKKMERNARNGREFQRIQIEKLASLDSLRNELSREAAKYEY